ncbi:hypothetical protein E2C01_101402 [Portunus trituberculatus]|uniref:Uncharacterized protein n=1 Tax=Portunus trituberculatus TaxID=210409 RepID=A0A5B7KG09_PORTR|nr:hypothetical protein [Portunus trituberculatus]
MAHYHLHYHCSGFALADDVTRFPEHPTRMPSSNNTSGKPPPTLQIHITNHQTHDFLHEHCAEKPNTSDLAQATHTERVEGTSSSASLPCDFQTLTEHHLTSPPPPPPTTHSTTAPTLPSPHHHNHLTPSPSTTNHLCTYYHHPLPSPAKRFILFITSHLSLHHHRHRSLIPSYPAPLVHSILPPLASPPPQCFQQLFVTRKERYGFLINHHESHEPYHFSRH